MLTIKDTHNQRLSRVFGILAENRIDALLVSHLENIRYLTGFSGTAGFLVIEQDRAMLYIDPRYTTQANDQTQGAAVYITSRDILGDVLKVLAAADHANLGFESHDLTHAQYSRLVQTLPSKKLVPTSEQVERLRAVKDAREVDVLRRAVNIADKAYKDFLKWLEPGLVEREVAARLEFFQRQQGGDRKPSETVVASGPRSALPHGMASERAIRGGEPVMIDIGAVVEGYTSDLTRTVHLGSPPNRFKEIYRWVREAQEHTETELHPGMTGQEVDALARNVIVGRGYGDRFGHATGHSLGLEIHERPHFSMTEQTVIEPGMVLTVEPGIYLPETFGVRIEDVVLVTKSGCEVLTTSSHELQVI